MTPDTLENGRSLANQIAFRATLFACSVFKPTVPFPDDTDQLIDKCRAWLAKCADEAPHPDIAATARMIGSATRLIDACADFAAERDGAGWPTQLARDSRYRAALDLPAKPTDAIAHADRHLGDRAQNRNQSTGEPAKASSQAE